MPFDPDLQPKFDAIEARLADLEGLSAEPEVFVLAAWEGLEAALYKKFDGFKGIERAAKIEQLTAILEKLDI